MGIELPAELSGIAQRTGAQWPAADEDAMSAQATAWRETAGKLRTLAGDADTSAGGALAGMAGDAGDAARKAWSGFVDPDKGALSAAAKGADRAADRLDHAARQIADGKVEMARQLVDALRNENAARAAADGGHPSALLGVQHMLGAVSTNLASVTDSLAGSVADTTRGLDPTEQVNPHPGARGDGGRGGLLNAVSGLGDGVVDAGRSATASVVDAGREASGVPGTAPGEAEALPPGTVDAALGTVSEVPDAAEAAVAPVAGAVDDVSPDAPTPAAGLPAGSTGGSFAEAVTPRSGLPIPEPGRPVSGNTALAGYADAPLPGPGPQGPPLPGAAAAGGAGQPGSAFGPFGGGGPGPPAPPQAGGAAGAAGPSPGAPARPVGQPARPFGGYADAGGQQPAQPPAPRPDPRAAQPPASQQPPPQRPEPPPQPAVGSPRQDRKSIAALFLVHMFPIGHLPVAAGEPARQLPPPPPDTDLAAALRFEPHDHPESHRIDTGDALAALDADATPTADEEPLPADHPLVAAVLDVYDPLAGMHERDWDRRYLVKQDDRSTEYAWPPGEVYPEGCYEDGEPVILASGTLLDRFGDPHGRVFAPDATAYHKRALPPPPDPAAGYRRYRVLRELPMWQGISASWFGQPGSAVRYRAVYPARDLVVLGYLADITAEPAEAQQPEQTAAGGEA